MLLWKRRMGLFKLCAPILVRCVFAFELPQTPGCSTFSNFHFNSPWIDQILFRFTIFVLTDRIRLDGWLLLARNALCKNESNPEIVILLFPIANRNGTVAGTIAVAVSPQACCFRFFDGRFSQSLMVQLFQETYCSMVDHGQ
jgi:hypothetical protein